VTVSDFTHLLAPGRIGSLQLANRIVMPAMDMNLSDDGTVTAPEIDHYVARARGGAGLVITGAGAVAWPVGATSWHQPGFGDDRHLPGLQALADAVHAVGGRVCMQLCHHGKTAAVDTAQGRPLLVPSAPTDHLDLSALQDCTMDELMRLATASQGRTPTYREADEDDLAWVIEQFAAAARRARSAGIDAVEVHAAHGYLLSTFLSAGYNRRTDRWGGSIENRARLTCEVVRAIRAEVGDGYPVLVRINGHEYGPAGGLTAAEAAQAARLIEAAGADAIHVSANAHNPFADFTAGPLPAEVAQYREHARTVKAAVSVPVIAVGRLLPEVAEEMLARGECDFVSMGRQLLADPELPAKLRAGRPSSVRPCINCYVCVEQNFFDATPRCAVNPALGNEELAELAPARERRHVVVVGGGPAGMEAARVAAARGHRVTLLERGDRLGGTAWFSQLTTPANELLVRWLAHEIGVLGVDVRLGQAATVESVGELRPDAVVVATGARRARPDVPGSDLSHVRTGDELRALITGDGAAAGKRSLVTRAALAAGRVLRITDDPDRIRSLSKQWMPIGKHVVVIGGGLVGLELAEFLAERGRQVAVLEAGPALGQPMAMPRRWAAVRRAADHGVALHRNATVLEIREHEVVYRVGDEQRTVAADDVIVAAHVDPDVSFAEQLRAAGWEVHVVGDAGQVGYLEGAIHSANAVARQL
jgi:2,4-dienoyl-CoA reductase-like NADH-dependent reductase (Old Yellow Enzyme family)/thioredoxin reductase